MAGQAEGWFKLADQDGDGAVGGAEAVRFFTRSGLPQDVLGQVRSSSDPYMVLQPAILLWGRADWAPDCISGPAAGSQ
jgi:hypothetical protein